MAKDKAKKQKRRWGPVALRGFGILLIVLVIVTYVPLSVPHWFGMDIYTITSGSMEPEIPVGSVVYVQPTAPADIADGDVIAFSSATEDRSDVNAGESFVVHRVVKNKTVEGEIETKGDANAESDPEPVHYPQVVGKVVLSVPMIGSLATAYATTTGKLYALGFVVEGLIMALLADWLLK